MQKIFNTCHGMEEYKTPNGSLFPEPPERCPHKGCHANIKQKKHGFYQRNIISIEFTGTIYIRRYICPLCGKTISMLPMFCLPYYQYSLQTIFRVLYTYFCSLVSISGIISERKKVYPALERRHIQLYRQRFVGNRQLIEYGMNNISPGRTLIGSHRETDAWAKDILDEMVKIPPSIFNQKFHQETGKSFMSRMKMIA